MPRTSTIGRSMVYDGSRPGSSVGRRAGDDDIATAKTSAQPSGIRFALSARKDAKSISSGFSLRVTSSGRAPQ
jgi:hypothetical protein